MIRANLGETFELGTAWLPRSWGVLPGIFRFHVGGAGSNPTKSQYALSVGRL